MTGKKKATKSFTLSNLEPFVMVVPTTGKAEVIGATRAARLRQGPLTRGAHPL